MYTDHFGFTERPFENNLDQRFLFLSRDHNEVLAALLFFIKENRPFAIICGDVGTGKTMVLNAFLDRLPPSHHPIFISNPLVEYRDILYYVAETLKINCAGKDVLPLVDKVKDALLANKENGHYYFLVIDEAHLLSDRSLDDIRLLSNIETRDRKLLQVLLVGQYELSHKLRRPEMRQLRQRISVNRFLSPLDSQETLAYIEHRLALVGSKFAHCFTADCLPLIFSLTDGVPRQINHLCDSAFLIAKIEGKKKVTKDILKKTDETLKSDVVLTPHAARPYKYFSRSIFPRPQRLFALAGTALGLATLVFGSAYLALFLSSRTQLPSAPLMPRPAAPAEKHKDSPTPTDVSTLPNVSPLVALANPVPASLSPAQDLNAADAGHQHPQAQTAQPDTLAVSSPQIAVSDSGASHDTEPLQHPRSVIVQDGDTIAGIASRYYPDDPHRSIRALLAANPHITNRNLIYPGQSITLPEITRRPFPVPTPEAHPQGPFALQLRQIFDSGKAVAEIYARYLRAQGYAACLSETESSQGKPAYALRLGVYETEQKAREAAAAFEQTQQTPCMVVPLNEAALLSSDKAPDATAQNTSRSAAGAQSTPTPVDSVP